MTRCWICRYALKGFVQIDGKKQWWSKNIPIHSLAWHYMYSYAHEMTKASSKWQLSLDKGQNTTGRLSDAFDFRLASTCQIHEMIWNSQIPCVWPQRASLLQFSKPNNRPVFHFAAIHKSLYFFVLFDGILITSFLYNKKQVPTWVWKKKKKS